MIEFDKKTEEWFNTHECAQTTLCRCKDCGQFYKNELGHNCEKKKNWECDVIYSCRCNEDETRFWRISKLFNSEEEAKFLEEKLNVLAEMQTIADKDESKVWDGTKAHYSIGYQCGEQNKIFIDRLYRLNYGGVAFSSRERAKECLETIGEDRIKKYYLGIAD